MCIMLVKCVNCLLDSWSSGNKWYGLSKCYCHDESVPVTLNRNFSTNVPSVYKYSVYKGSVWRETCALQRSKCFIGNRLHSVFDKHFHALQISFIMTSVLPDCSFPPGMIGYNPHEAANQAITTVCDAFLILSRNWTNPFWKLTAGPGHLKTRLDVKTR